MHILFCIVFQITIVFLSITLFPRQKTQILHYDPRKNIQYSTLLLHCHLHHHSASQRHNIKDRRMNKRRMIKTQEGRHRKTSWQIYLPLALLQGFERVVQSLHVRGCWRPNINFIFWPHCYDRHVEAFLFSWCRGPLHRGSFQFNQEPSWLPIYRHLAFPRFVSLCQITHESKTSSWLKDIDIIHKIFE